MSMFNNKFTLGVAAGIIGNTVKIVYEYIVYAFDRNIEPLSHLATTSVLPVENHDNIPNLIVGTYADYVVASILGIITVYLLYYTSIKHYLLKGLVIGSAAWLLIYIPATQFEIIKINPIEVSANIAYIITHLLLCLTIAWTIAKYGKEALAKPGIK